MQIGQHSFLNVSKYRLSRSITKKGKSLDTTLLLVIKLSSLSFVVPRWRNVDKNLFMILCKPSMQTYINKIIDCTSPVTSPGLVVVPVKQLRSLKNVLSCFNEFLWTTFYIDCNIVQCIVLVHRMLRNLVYKGYIRCDFLKLLFAIMNNFPYL